jgi:hypothetical protein
LLVKELILIIFLIIKMREEKMQSFSFLPYLGLLERKPHNRSRGGAKVRELSA